MLNKNQRNFRKEMKKLQKEYKGKENDYYSYIEKRDIPGYYGLKTKMKFRFSQLISPLIILFLVGVGLIGYQKYAQPNRSINTDIISYMDFHKQLATESNEIRIEAFSIYDELVDKKLTKDTFNNRFAVLQNRSDLIYKKYSSYDLTNNVLQPFHNANLKYTLSLNETFESLRNVVSGKATPQEYKIVEEKMKIDVQQRIIALREMFIKVGIKYTEKEDGAFTYYY